MTVVDTVVTYRNLGSVGRLGNALYELAATIGLARAHGAEPRFPADWLHRPYFSVPDSMFGDCTAGVEATELVDHFDPRERDYLQDYRLFGDVLDELRGYLAPSTEAQAALDALRALPRPILGVHVRRGDNVPHQDPGVRNKHLYFPLPSLRYYQAAIARKRPQAASIAVFSDEPEWARVNFPDADYIDESPPYVKEHEAAYGTYAPSDWAAWHRLSACDLAVLSNSTFGFTATLLRGHDSRPVVPWPIYGSKLAHIHADWAIPAAWVRLSTTSGASLP